MHHHPCADALPAGAVIFSSGMMRLPDEKVTASLLNAELFPSGTLHPRGVGGDIGETSIVQSDERPETQPENLSLPPVAQRRPLATWTMLVCCVVIFGLTELAGGSQNAEVLLRFGGNAAEYVLNGEWWRLVGAMFLHIGVLHLLVNMYSLWLIGVPLERLIGSPSWLFCYAISGICASLLSCAWHAKQARIIVSAGASGALFGLIGALAVVALLRKDLAEDGRRKLVQSLFKVIVYNLVISLVAGFDNAAHIGGLLGGAACGLVVSLSPFKTPPLQTVLLVIGLLPFPIEGYVLYHAYQPPPSLASSGTKKYVDPRGRFTVEYPAPLMLSSTTDDVVTLRMPGVMLAATCDAAPASIAGLKKMLVEKWVRLDDRSLVEHHGRLDWTIFSGENQGHETGRVAVAVTDKCRYAIFAYAPAQRADDVKAGFDLILDHFEPGP